MKIRQTLKNESGVILLTVIALTTLLSVVIVSIIAINISQSKSSKSISDSIKASQLALGESYKYYQARMDDTSYTASQSCETIDGKEYCVEISNTGSGGPLNTDKIEININY